MQQHSSKCCVCSSASESAASSVLSDAARQASAASSKCCCVKQGPPCLQVLLSAAACKRRCAVTLCCCSAPPAWCVEWTRECTVRRCCSCLVAALLQLPSCSSVAASCSAVSRTSSTCLTPLSHACGDVVSAKLQARYCGCRPFVLCGRLVARGSSAFDAKQACACARLRSCANLTLEMCAESSRLLQWDVWVPLLAQSSRRFTMIRTHVS